MKVSVVGAGPVGTTLAARLLAANHEVTIVEIDPRVREELLQRG
ncbi:MAG: NAD-binding protein, partial [Spirochaetota bacterium]